MKILEFKNITVLRDNQRILDGVDLDISTGENTAILGPNGSGKSTLIKLMTREIYPYKMEPHVFRIFGETNWDVTALRKSLGIVSDSMTLFANPDETCFEIVASSFYNTMNLYNMEADKAVAQKAMEHLEFMDVDRLKDRLISEVSSGEARRVFIARALAHNPKALMLDEPTNSLDISAVRRFRETMSKIAKKGVTVIIATHTLQDIIPEVKNVVMLKKGRVFKAGKKKDLLTDKILSELFEVKVKVKNNGGHFSIS
jgi:iron complex transport system ATP-binding protein